MTQPPENWSWDLPSSATPRRALPQSSSFGRTVAFTVAGTAVPGVGLIAGRRRVAGFIVLGVFVLGLLSLGVAALVAPERLAALAVRPSALMTVSVVLIVLALAWVGVVVFSHLSLRGPASRAQRVIGGVLVGVLSFAVAAPMAVAARYSYDQAGLVNGVFKSQTQTKSATRPTMPAPDPAQPQADPWADKPRLNLLLLGGDDGPGRTGTRTDTIILASIDTQTGDTTLFSLPRNTGRMPFPKSSPLHDVYPYGFTNGDGNDPEHFLNAMYGNVARDHPGILGETDNLGADAMKLSVGDALGLKVDYYVLINLKNFTKMIDALGGITVNVNSYVPIGGNTDLHIPPKEYITPGENKHLAGREALWFARGRYGSDDFVRMGRQRCVINAIIKQANPTNVLSRYEQIAKAGKEIIKTDMPQEILPAMVELSLRVKGGNVRSVLFQHGRNGFLSPNPNFPLMREQVKEALGEAKKKPASSSKPKAKKSASPSSQPTTASEDVNDTCAYDAEAAASAPRPYGY